MRKTITLTIIIIFFAALIVTTSFAVFYMDLVSKIPGITQNFSITAHTGCDNTPKNSLQSIAAGINDGANAVEFDVRFLDDGTPVLSHDFDEKNENSVQLDSAFNLLFPYSIKINLDMKETHYIDKVASLIEFYSLDDRSFLTGITEDKVEQVKSLAPNIDFYLNIKIPISKKYNVSYINEIGEKAKALGAIGINLHHSNITKESVSLWHSQGLLVSVYTANSAFDINVALYKNVDNITTLKPLRAVKNLKNL